MIQNVVNVSAQNMSRPLTKAGEGNVRENDCPGLQLYWEMIVRHLQISRSTNVQEDVCLGFLNRPVSLYFDLQKLQHNLFCD